MRLILIEGKVYNLDALVCIREVDEQGRRVNPTRGFWAGVDPKGKTSRVENAPNSAFLVFPSGPEIELNREQVRVVRNILLDPGEEAINLDDYGQ